MSQYLFLFTISPVQSFISQARKTQDLWAASRILSELTKAGMKAFEVGEANIIFPNKKNTSKPNRFLGKIENCDNLKSLGEKVEKAVRDKFKELAKKAFDKSGASPKPNAFDTQIENHLEIFWIFEPIADNSNEAYKTAYKNIEQNLGAIKNVRTFKQMPEAGKKCSLDGERNALFYKRNENGKVPNFINIRETTEIKEENQDEVKVAKGEGLSAVSLMKRFYDFSGFPSTAKIALMYDEQEAIKNNKIENCLKSYKNIFSSEKEFLLECMKIQKTIKFDNKKELITQFDYQQLFEENVSEKNIPNLEQLNCALKILSTLKSYFKTKYYALLVFDGDYMGKMLSGELLKDKETTDLQTYQNKISTLLGTYANWAKGYLDEKNHNGRAVYAGGDDFLGFVNLHHLFIVLEKVRQKFDTDVNKELQKIYPLQEPFTFSAGICIAHYETPLDIVLKTAKEMEHKAKEEGGRDSFAISVLKHSGESHETVLKWGNSCQNLIFMKEITESLEKDFSAKWIKNIQEEFILIVNKDNKFEITHQAMFKTEMKRLLARSCNLQSKEKAERVGEISDKTELLLSSIKYHFGNFSQALNIAKFINKELKNQ